MNKLIELFNKKYGDKYGKISYPRTTLQIYRVYQTIKSYGIEDNELIGLLHKIELPKPKNTEEWELYVDCLYNKDDNELENQLLNITQRMDKSNSCNMFVDNTYYEKTWDRNYYVYKSYLTEEAKQFFQIPPEVLLNKIFIVKMSLQDARNEDNTAVFEGKMKPMFDNLNTFTLYCDNPFENVKKGEIIFTSINDTSVTYNLSFPKGGAYASNNYSTIMNSKIEIIILDPIIDTSAFATKNNPVFTGSISINRKEGTVIGDCSVAIGNFVEASEYCSYAEGCQTIASGVKSHAEGDNTKASNSFSHAEGNHTKANGESSHAEGFYTEASGKNSHAEGNQSVASGDSSHAEGYQTTASGVYSHAEGIGTVASGRYQHVQGKFNISDPDDKYLHIVGNGTNREESNAHTLDWNGNGWYSGKLSQEGTPTNDKDLVTKKYVDSSLTNVVYKGDNIPYIKEERVLCEITEEQLTTAWTKCQASTDSSMYIELPIFDFSEDNFSLHYIFVNGKEYLIEADYNQSYGENNTRHFFEFYSIDDETNNISGGCICTKYDVDWDDDETKAIVKIDRVDTSQAPTFTSSIKLIEKEISPFNTTYLGKNITLDQPVTIGDRKEGVEVGNSSLTIGYDNQASSSCFAQGYKCEANGSNSFVQGDSCKANGSNSFAQGYKCEANANWSFAHGFLSIASNSCSHAEGNYTIASSENQHVQGKYNIEDKNNKYAHIVGNGDCSPKTNNKIVRSNAHTLDWDGNGWYAGKLSQEGTPTEDKDLVTKKYVDDKILTGTSEDITNLTNRLNSLADSDDETLDQLSEIVTYIKNNKSLIDGVTTSKVNVSDIIDNLTTEVTNKPLSAKQGKALKDLIDAITVPTKTSQLTNDSKFLTAIPSEYVTDTKLNTMFSFNDSGELVVTIGEVSKIFVPKSE